MQKEVVSVLKSVAVVVAGVLVANYIERKETGVGRNPHSDHTNSKTNHTISK